MLDVVTLFKCFVFMAQTQCPTSFQITRRLSGRSQIITLCAMIIQGDPNCLLLPPNSAQCFHAQIH